MDTKELSLQEGPQPIALPVPTVRPPRKCPVCKQVEGTKTEDGYAVEFTDGNRRCKVCVTDSQRARRADARKAKDELKSMFERVPDTNFQQRLTELETAMRAWALVTEQHTDKFVELHRKLETEVGLIRSAAKDCENEHYRNETSIVLGLSGLHNQVDLLKAEVAALKAPKPEQKQA